jgi:hypothetical protein
MTSINPYEPPQEKGVRKKRRLDWPTIVLTILVVWFGVGAFAIIAQLIMFLYRLNQQLISA